MFLWFSPGYMSRGRSDAGNSHVLKSDYDVGWGKKSSLSSFLQL